MRLRRLLRQLETSGAQAVVIHGCQDARFARSVHMRGVPVAYTPHSPVPLFREIAATSNGRDSLIGQLRTRRAVRMARANESELFRVAKIIVFPSPGAVEEYADTLHPEWRAKVRFVPSGVPEPETSSAPTAAVARRVPTILFAGRYVEHKGFDIYCAAARIVQGQTNAAFQSMGSGPIAATQPVLDLGWVEEPSAILNASDIVVVPNRVAYFDLLPLEAAAHGAALVFTPVGGNVDQATSFPASVLAEGTSPTSVAAAILQAVQLVRQSPDWGSQNRESFQQMYSSTAMTRSWDTLCRDDLL
ncbi:glycosyltransferase family 4 protein [Nocardioides abyssi]|uniref:glycosyltransferase family 4 protein n=1 Tax=Nocardioides abyssi TaxID=3058370 RepID=UPI0034DF7CDB